MPVRDLLSAASGASNYGPADPYFYDVSLLLNGEGTNGAQNNTFLDSSTNNFTITRNGNTTQGSFSPYGSLWSNYFPAGGNYCITTPASSNTSLGAGNFTMEAWVNVASFGAYYNIIACKWDYPNKEWLLQCTASSINVYLSTDGLNDSATFTASANIPLGAWNHIAVTRSGSSLYFFLNGNLISTQSITQTFYASSQVTAIGNFPSSGISDTGMRGYISNFRLVKGTALYTSSFTPSTTPLTAVSGTQLLTCQSSRYLDNSSNNFTVTATSSNSVQRFSPFNPTSTYSTSVIGGSGYFDGSGDSLVCGTSSNLALGSGDFTVDGWYYLNDQGGGAAIYSQINTYPSSTGLLLYVANTNTLTVDCNGTIITGGSSPKKQWTHFSLVRSGSTLTLYINAVSVGTASLSTNLTDQYATLGQTGAGETSNPFNGYLSNVRIVKGTAITPTVPTAPTTAVSGTQYLANMTNAGIPDLAMQNDLQTVGSAQVSTSVKKYGTGSLSFVSGSALGESYIPQLNFGSGDFTIECWVYETSQSGNQAIFSQTNNSSYFILHNSLSSDGKLALYIDTLGGAPAIQGTTVLSTNTWYHVALSRASGVFKLFLNGVQEGSSYTNSGNPTPSGTPSFYVGNNNTTNGAPFLGYIDDFRVTSGLARYTTTFTPPTAALPTY